MYRRPPRSPGFTLIELMVVIFILGVIASFAVLSVSGRDGGDALGEEVARCAELLTLASEEAVISGRQMGVRLTPQGYAFLRYEERQWVATEDDKLLRPRHLPEALDAELRLYIDGLPVALDDAPRGAGEETDEGPRPHLLLLASGEQTAAELVFASRDPRGARFRLQLPPLGRPSWVRLDTQETR